MLLSAMGAKLGAYLHDDTITDVLLNPDGCLWVDRLGEGRINTGHTLTPADGERIIRLVASSMDAECNALHPRLSAELPGSGARFEAKLPPLVRAPTFAIRKKATRIFTLEDFVSQGVITVEQQAILRAAVAGRRNIIVAGGTQSGKTTFTNALLAEIGAQGHRLVILEDTQELQYPPGDVVPMWTKDGIASMSDLLRDTLRMRPDRIVVGEVRGAEAYELIEAWNTGHPGGVSTLHADSAGDALYRLETMMMRSPHVTQWPLHALRGAVARAVHYIVFITKTDHGRRVREIARLDGLAGDQYQLASHPVP
ncbi:MAG: P-type conjugative transfer ATPase TrbB [Chromatiales bacterium 21-64-14]|nr:MAG: P-type conjugative transfer ATPase TrbB [Chromatiales bacterium 21-64-14]